MNEEIESEVAKMVNLLKARGWNVELESIEEDRNEIYDEDSDDNVGIETNATLTAKFENVVGNTLDKLLLGKTRVEHARELLDLAEAVKAAVALKATSE